MEKINKQDTLLAGVRIYLDGINFYRTAYTRNPTLDNKDKLFQVMLDATLQIEELVNGKTSS